MTFLNSPMFGRSFAAVLAALLSTGPLAPGKTGAPQVPAERVLLADGRPARDEFFPIAVWLQQPRNALRFKAAGINLYVGLWQGPTEAQLTDLTKAGMPVICAQNEFALSQKTNPIIAGWMQEDEPDNAQALGAGKGYGPPVLPEKIVQLYQQMRSRDPSRPVLLNLGQGVAFDRWIGRGVRTNHPEDYRAYAKGADIVSFDIYPAVHHLPEVAGKLEYVATGVERLVSWTGGRKPVWNCIECTHIGNPRVKATPAQVKSEVWMALIRGSRGLIYFVHQFKPAFKEAALLDDPEMLAAVTAINAQIRELAPVLNSPTIASGVKVKSSDEAVPVAVMMKRHKDATYVFAVNLRNKPVRASFTLQETDRIVQGDVLEEARRVTVREGQFEDDFSPYGVHQYRLK